MGGRDLAAEHMCQFVFKKECSVYYLSRRGTKNRV